MRRAAWTLTIDHPDLTTNEEVHAESEDVLRMLGRDHHRQAQIVPDLTLTDPQGRVVAMLDHWASDWTDQEGA
ncbi:hypothetical protein [Jannaschia sp. LMIT008]|uniref:hypothetical protein n=1 Tax=Jannaschia maritima TaxID=3032585 RepID=UPI0028126756|nr:hypothetical protein [Jannaschia sp. LMIT008]